MNGISRVLLSANIYRCYVASEGVMQKCCTRKKKTISARRRSPSAEMVFFLPSAAFLASHPSEIHSNGILTQVAKFEMSILVCLRICHPALGHHNPGAVFKNSDAHAHILKQRC